MKVTVTTIYSTYPSAPAANKYSKFRATHKKMRLLFILLYACPFIGIGNKLSGQYGFSSLSFLAILAALDLYRIVNLFCRYRIQTIVRKSSPGFSLAASERDIYRVPGAISGFLGKAAICFCAWFFCYGWITLLFPALGDPVAIPLAILPAAIFAVPMMIVQNRNRGDSDIKGVLTGICLELVLIPVVALIFSTGI